MLEPGPDSPALGVPAPGRTGPGRIRGRSLLSDSARLVGVTALAQVLFLLLAPVLARRFAPADFGVLGFFNAVLALLLPVACVRFDYAIPVVDDHDLGDALAAAALLCLAFCAALGLALACLRRLPSGRLCAELYALRFEIAGSAAFLGLGQIAVFLATRKRQFAFVGLLKGGVNAVFALAALVPGAGLVRAQILAYAICLFIFCGNRAFFSRERLSWSRLRRHGRRFRSHLLINFPTAIMDTFSLSAPVLVLNSTYSKASVGCYTQAQRLGCGLIILAGAAIGQVFFQRASTAHRQGRDLRRLLRRAFGALVLVSASNGIVLWSAGAWLFGLYLGKRWHLTTVFIMLATLPTLLRMTVSPLSFIFFATERLKVYGCWQAAHCLLNCGLLPWLARRLDLHGFLLCYLAIIFAAARPASQAAASGATGG